MKLIYNIFRFILLLIVAAVFILGIGAADSFGNPVWLVGIFAACYIVWRIFKLNELVDGKSDEINDYEFED